MADRNGLPPIRDRSSDGESWLDNDNEENPGAENLGPIARPPSNRSLETNGREFGRLSPSLPFAAVPRYSSNFSSFRAPTPSQEFTRLADRDLQFPLNRREIYQRTPTPHPSSVGQRGPLTRAESSRRRPTSPIYHLPQIFMDQRVIPLYQPTPGPPRTLGALQLQMNHPDRVWRSSQLDDVDELDSPFRTRRPPQGPVLPPSQRSPSPRPMPLPRLSGNLRMPRQPLPAHRPRLPSLGDLYEGSDGWSGTTAVESNWSFARTRGLETLTLGQQAREREIPGPSAQGNTPRLPSPASYRVQSPNLSGEWGSARGSRTPPSPGHPIPQQQLQAQSQAGPDTAGPRTTTADASTNTATPQPVTTNAPPTSPRITVYPLNDPAPTEVNPLHPVSAESPAPAHISIGGSVYVELSSLGRIDGCLRAMPSMRINGNVYVRAARRKRKRGDASTTPSTPSSARESGANGSDADGEGSDEDDGEDEEDEEEEDSSSFEFPSEEEGDEEDEVDVNDDRDSNEEEEEGEEEEFERKYPGCGRY
ncbi:hypothetical protein F4806DRAFT_492785 [Annulohypoxylon nitens]|nr:hypothetical protein F4806DRAFT_492785 [Annulohypoxylon nitens]